jgi:hypothetical protein
LNDPNQNTPPQGGWGAQPAPIATFGQPGAQGAEATQDERMMGAVAHGLTFFEGGLIGPLILYFIKKDESEFIAFHSLQSLYFGLAFFAATILTCGIGAIFLVWPYFIFEGIAAMRAYEGQWYELPIVGKYAREKHPG